MQIPTRNRASRQWGKVVGRIPGYVVPIGKVVRGACSSILNFFKSFFRCSFLNYFVVSVNGNEKVVIMNLNEFLHLGTFYSLVLKEMC